MVKLIKLRGPRGITPETGFLSLHGPGNLAIWNNNEMPTYTGEGTEGLLFQIKGVEGPNKYIFYNVFTNFKIYRPKVLPGLGDNRPYGPAAVCRVNERLFDVWSHGTRFLKSAREPTRLSYFTPLYSEFWIIKFKRIGQTAKEHVPRKCNPSMSPSSVRHYGHPGRHVFRDA